MTDTSFLIVPFVTMNGTSADCDANRKSYDPFAVLGAGGLLPYGYKTLEQQLGVDYFDLAEVLRTWQPLGVVPASAEGRITLLLDRNTLYDKECGYSASYTGVFEDGHPRGTVPLAYIDWTPGQRNPFATIQPPLGGVSRRIRKGDRIGIAAEANNINVGAGALQAAFSLGIAGWTGVELAPGVVHAMPLNVLAAPAGWPSYRGVVPVKAGGSRVKMRISAPQAYNLTLNHVGVGIRSGSAADMAATPVAVLFGGNVGVTVPAGTSIECDDITLTVPDNSCLVFDMNVSATTFWAYKKQAGAMSGVNTWASQTASWNTASQPVPLLQPGKLDNIDYVKVWTP